LSDLDRVLVLNDPPAGCGNAFCGGFLASRLAGEEVLDGAVWGSVAASVMAGVLD
jgi:sugar/nucleoside kinase (ribokinase family)